jgi:hypothetical protein
MLQFQPSFLYLFQHPITKRIDRYITINFEATKVYSYCTVELNSVLGAVKKFLEDQWCQDVYSFNVSILDSN